MDASVHRILVSHAPPEAYAPMTRPILAKLGYAILLPEEFDAIAGEVPLRPAVRIVDERQLAEVPEDPDHLPIIVITGRHGVTGADPRIVGAIRRPAGMHELFRLVQQVTEDTPRTTPRVATHLRARCSREGDEWPATVLSLSENGCLIRSPEPLLLGARFDLEFALPGSGPIRVEAEIGYQLLPDVGVIFNSAPTRQRKAIEDYVTRVLAEPAALSGAAG